MADLMPNYVLGTVLPRGDLSSYQAYQFYGSFRTTGS